LFVELQRGFVRGIASTSSANAGGRPVGSVVSSFSASSKRRSFIAMRACSACTCSAAGAARASSVALVVLPPIMPGASR